MRLEVRDGRAEYLFHLQEQNCGQQLEAVCQLTSPFPSSCMDPNGLRRRA